MNRITVFPRLPTERVSGGVVKKVKEEKKRQALMIIWGYENMSDTCALNKGWSEGISDSEELGSRGLWRGTWDR